MVIYHCSECHHEWQWVKEESPKDYEKCDWCGAEGYILPESIYFEDEED